MEHLWTRYISCNKALLTSIYPLFMFYRWVQ